MRWPISQFLHNLIITQGRFATPRAHPVGITRFAAPQQPISLENIRSERHQSRLASLGHTDSSLAIITLNKGNLRVGVAELGAFSRKLTEDVVI